MNLISRMPFQSRQKRNVVFSFVNIIIQKEHIMRRYDHMWNIHVENQVDFH